MRPPMKEPQNERLIRMQQEQSAVPPGTRLAEHCWSELSRRMPVAGLDRIRALFDVFEGRLEPDLAPRQSHSNRWFMPGLPSTPWLAREPFEDLARELESLYPELRREVLAEVASGTFRPYGLAPGELDRVHPSVFEVEPGKGAPGFDELKLWDGL